MNEVRNSGGKVPPDCACVKHEHEGVQGDDTLRQRRGFPLLMPSVHE